MTMRPGKRAILSVMLALGAACSACTDQNQSRTQAAPALQPQSSPPIVEVAQVISQRLNTVVDLPAQLAPYEVVDVFPKVAGFVKWIKVDVGARVRKGELIAQLEAPELEARKAEAESRYQSAEAQLVSAQAKLAADKATYRRMSAASKTPGVVAGNDLEVAQKTVQADEGDLTALQKNVKAAQDALRAVAQLEAYLNIRAPFDGEVTARYVHPGALVGPPGGPGATTPLVRIETLTRHRLLVPVPEYDANSVPEGREVDFTVPSLPGRHFHAPIARISHSVDIRTRTMSVELDVQDPHAQLIPGTFCHVAWPVHRGYTTLFVPSSAIANNLERTFVIRIQNRRTEWVDVKTGETSGQQVEVFGNLQVGDQVVLRATDELQPGTLVSPRLAPSEGSE